MKINFLTAVFPLLLIALSCSLLRPQQNMFEQNNLRKAFGAFREKAGTKESLYEIEIFPTEIIFNSLTKRFVYSRGFLRETGTKTPSQLTPFLLEEVDFSAIDKAMSAAVELAKKNPYLDKTEVSRVVFTKQKVNREDNLVSNVGKWREAIRLDVYVADSDNVSQYTTNLKGEIVDVAATNVKPRIKFMDTTQMQKSLAEIRPLFGEKIFVSDFTIQQENFSFTAADPKNSQEINVYRFDSQEFLRADDASAFIQGPTFDLNEIDLSLIPRVLQTTMENTSASNAKVASITIRRIVDKFKNTSEIEWRVESVGDRSEKKVVIFDKQGNVKNIN